MTNEVQVLNNKSVNEPCCRQNDVSVPTDVETVDELVWLVNFSYRWFDLVINLNIIQLKKRKRVIRLLYAGVDLTNVLLFEIWLS